MASADRAKFGNRCVRAYAQEGWTIYPIHPSETAIEGIISYRSIRDVPPGPIDLVSVYLPASRGLAVMDEIAERGDVREVMLNPGADDPEVIANGRVLGLNVVSGCSLIAFRGA